MILLTGAAGVVGSTIAEQLGEPGVMALRHSRPVEGAAGELIGDITQVDLGLSPAEYRRACERVATVVHSAASVTMAGRPEDYERINIEGTRNVVRFAEDAGARLVHVSTAFVHAAVGGETLSYAESKRRAEEVVRASAVRWSIVRPSIVAGDSTSGRIVAQQGFHQVMASLLHGPVRIVPGDASAIVDFVPQDYVAAVVAGVVADPHSPAELWLTSGDRALRAAEVVRRVNALIEECDLPGRPARLVAEETVKRLFVPVFLTELPARQRARMKVLLHLAEQMRIDAELPSSSAAIERELGVALPDPAAVLDSNLRALLERAVHTTPLLAL